MAPNAPSRFFPPLAAADADGLLLIGGKLQPDWLRDAYCRGIFPWPVSVGRRNLLAWWSPDPRAVIELDGLHVSRRLARTVRSGRFEVTCDRDFAGVMAGCAAPRRRQRGTWITPEMAAAYQELHTLGDAHSVEVWHEGQLAGGVYGVAIGGLFAGESMFHRVRDASKVALVRLVAHLRRRGYALFDVQQWTPHTGRMGAHLISRDEFLSRLAVAIDLPVTWGEQLEGVEDA